MIKEELDKQIDRWLKRRETIKPFIDRMVKLNVRRVCCIRGTHVVS